MKTTTVKLHEKQREVILKEKKYTVIKAGRRSGKTVLAIEKALKVATAKSGRSVIYIAVTQVQARQIVWAMLKNRVGHMGKANETRLEMTVPTKDGGKSTIFLSGWESREVFRGRNAKFIIFDEVDSYTSFAVGLQEIFKPAILDTDGDMWFIGTPRPQTSNMLTLKALNEEDEDWAFFHYTSYDNPHLDHSIIDKERDVMTPQIFQQEYMAEYPEGDQKLFDMEAVAQMFNLHPNNARLPVFLSIDPAAPKSGKDNTLFALRQGDQITIETCKGLNREELEDKVLEYEQKFEIPRKNIIGDKIGVGEYLIGEGRLSGMTIFKGSFAPIKTEVQIAKFAEPGKVDVQPSTSEYANLRTQTYFSLAAAINKRTISVKCTGKEQGRITAALSATVEQTDTAKIKLIPKDDIKKIIRRSPDEADAISMLFFYQILNKTNPSLNAKPLKERKFMKKVKKRLTFR